MLHANGAIVDGSRWGVEHRVRLIAHGRYAVGSGDLYIERIGHSHGSAEPGENSSVTHVGHTHAGVVGRAFNLVGEGAIVFSLHQDIDGIAKTHGRVGNGDG